MGSGAAVSVALVRALSSFLGAPLATEIVTDLAYEIEKIHHGTPSGIDNTVIAYNKPVYFKRGESIKFLKIKHATHWVIADTGEKTPTHKTVSAVREQHAQNPEKYNAIFHEIGKITQKARQALTRGDVTALGQLMNENQSLLEALRVSSSALNTLINAAKSAGASGAKLSGGGCGGNMIALAPHADSIENIERELKNAGAVRVIHTTLKEINNR
jgi:mevalonate kinase